MSKWEYNIIDSLEAQYDRTKHRFPTNTELIEYLNLLGKEEWEVISVTKDSGDGRWFKLFLKRPII